MQMRKIHGCGATMVGHLIHYESGHSAKYYSCGNHWKQFKGVEKCGFKAIDTVAHKVDDAVWSWLKNLLCDADALETGLNELIENRSIEISPKLNRLKPIEGLIREEETKIKRLINQMSYHDDEMIIAAFRSGLEQASQNNGALIEERNKLADELDHLQGPNDQREQILESAARIRDRIMDATFEQKRRIMDLLEVQVVIHYDDQGKWLEVTCAIPAYNDAIELHPSRGMLRDQGKYDTRWQAHAL
jgi:hypothetical protein